MSRRANTHVRCPHCHVHAELCFCQEIPRLETRTKLLLVIHFREARKPTNTGQLAAKCLVNSEVFLRGQIERSALHLTLDPKSQPVLLFPSEFARPLEDFRHSTEPVTLIVPDGNWRQASKVRARHPELDNAPIVGLPVGPSTTYRLRQESQPGGLATMEAIARAYGILEGPRVQAELERVFRILVERTLWTRGDLRAGDITDGLPHATTRDAAR